MTNQPRGYVNVLDKRKKLALFAIAFALVALFIASPVDDALIARWISKR